jgi:hypothetical protein
VAEPGLSDDFRDLLIELADASAEFLVIGGWALALHGYGRSTDDMDILVRPSTENAQRVFSALARYGVPVAAHGVTEELFAQKKYGYRLGVKPNLIELLTTIDGVEFDEAWHGRKSFHLDGREIPFIGRAALIKNKRAAGRAKDLADIEWLVTHPEHPDGSCAES